MRNDPQAQAATRSCKKLIRFTPAELARVNERARAASQPVACYIRDASLGSKRRAAPTVLGATVIHELARVATRLGRLRDAASALALPEAAEFGGALDELLGLIRQID
jgi:hypothetical protein